MLRNQPTGVIWDVKMQPVEGKLVRCGNTIHNFDCNSQLNWKVFSYHQQLLTSAIATKA
jgi:hypothetical protein